MGAVPTVPLRPEIVEYEAKARVWILMAMLTSFTIIVVIWSFWPPRLPGDSAGAIIGGFIGWIGGMTTRDFLRKNQ